MTIIPGGATAAATAAFAARSGVASPCYRRMAGSWTVASVGLGTYLGNPDARTDALCEAAVRDFVAGGINVLDTAIVYRGMLAERAVGRALAAAIAAGAVRREELVVATKGGYLSVDAAAARDAAGYVERTFYNTGLLRRDQVVDQSHSLAVPFLEHQLTTSLANLGLATADVWFLHNPETQLTEIPMDRFLGRMEEAFGWLEQEVERGRVQLYGAATWSGFRSPPGDREHLPLERLVRLAEKVGGAGHHFRVIQLPYNAGMSEALAKATQPLGKRMLSALAAAAELGLTVWTSASIMQGKVLGHTPRALATALPGHRTEFERALEFTRSSPGVQVALIGAKQPDHVQQALALFRREPVAGGIIERLVTR